tara:strand:+ start:16501 stop:17352 length:852 start_codon:yes stop_codon:yes gene_type:complete
MGHENKKRVYCLKAKPLYAAETQGLYHQRGVQPLFCHCNANDELVALVVHLREQLMALDLYQVSKAYPDARWFFELGDRYYSQVTSFIHVTHKMVYFSGHLLPYESPQFQSCAIPIAELLFNQGEFKNIDPVVHYHPRVKGLIDEIVSKEAELSRRFDQACALERLVDAMGELDEVTSVINTDLEAHQHRLKMEASELSHQYDQLERDIKALSLKMLYQCFQVQVGDWVVSNVLTRGKTIQLVVASASYSNGWLFINGTNVTQKGVVGKRDERIALKVLPDEH